MNKKLWKISMILLSLKLVFWLVYIGAIVYGSNIQLTNDQMGYWAWISFGWGIANSFWAIEVWAK